MNLFETPTDTRWLQFLSVLRFAEMIGWRYNEQNRGFYKKFPETRYISFLEMQSFHNECIVWKAHRNVKPAYGINRRFLNTDYYIYTNAQKSKLINRSFLYYNKKLKEWRSQRDWVELNV